ncbi:MAG: molecular chaperone [Dehalococcoidia bacterium]
MSSDVPETLVRSALYELLSVAFLYPRPGRVEMLQDGVGQLSVATEELGWHDLAAELQRLGDQLTDLDDADLERDYIGVFGHTISTDCPPYETEYDQAHVFQKSQTLADLGAFYQAFGVQVNSEMKERLDHISVELEFMNLLTFKEAYADLHRHGADKVRICREAQGRFLSYHLAGWIKSFAEKLGRRAGDNPLYASLGRVLERHTDREFQRFGLEASPFEPLVSPPPPETELDCAAEALEDAPLQELKVR